MIGVMKKYLISLSLFVSASLVLSAQTDYDIRVFLDNVENEKPFAKDLPFYLSAGQKLFNEGKMVEAAVFYDFAASLGSSEGFRGMAAVETGESRRIYERFAFPSSDGAAKLLSALSRAGTELSSALLVHDNLDVYSLKYLRDPLIEWMPTHASDTAFLRKNDAIAYLIAKTKEDAGNRFEALLIYELAAWEGNYEALKKASVFGRNIDEIRQKEALKKRMGKYKDDKEYLFLHKFFAGEKLTCTQYASISYLFDDPNEKLVTLALGTSEPIYASALEKRDYIVPILVALMNARGNKRQLTKDIVIRNIQKHGYKPVLEEILNCMGKMSDREWDLYFELESAERTLQKQNVSADPFYMSRLKEYIKSHPKNLYSPEAISFIRNYYKENPLPWADVVLDIVNSVPVDKKAKYTGTNNIYYPLYKKGLFSKLHHTEEVMPNRIDIGL